MEMISLTIICQMHHRTSVFSCLFNVSGWSLAGGHVPHFDTCGPFALGCSSSHPLHCVEERTGNFLVLCNNQFGCGARHTHNNITQRTMLTHFAQFWCTSQCARARVVCAVCADLEEPFNRPLLTTISCLGYGCLLRHPLRGKLRSTHVSLQLKSLANQVISAQFAACRLCRTSPCTGSPLHN